MKKLALLLALVSLMAGCKKENGREIFYYPSAGVFVINEGNFNNEDASLTYFNPATGEAEQEVCYLANNRPLGDVAQSMTIIGKKGFVVVNNSNTVVAIDTDNFEYIGQIDGLNSPRYVLPVSGNKIYISSMFSNKITIADPNSYLPTGKEIDLGDGDGLFNSSEQMVKVGNDVFVCSWSYNNKIFRINTQTDLVTGTITLDYAQPQSIVVDKNGKLWVASDGGYEWEGAPSFTPTESALTRIDAKTFTVEKTFVFSGSDSPSKLAINAAGDKIYFINNAWGVPGGAGDGVFEMSITANALPVEPLIPMGDALFYGLGVDPGNGDIYVSDAVSYFPVGNGKAYQYSSSGKLIKEFATGIFPGGFCFKP